METDDEFTAEDDFASEVVQGSVFMRDSLDADDNDPFAKNIDELTLKGLGQAARKRKERLTKMYTGADGAKSKSKHEHKEGSGYDLLDVARPVYNLDALRKLMNADYTNYAAIRIKTSYTVGLGFDLIDSHKTREKKDRLDNDEEKVKNFRRNVSRAKSQVFDWLDTLNDEDSIDDVLEKVFVDFESTGNGYLEIGRTKLGQIGYIGHIPSHSMRVRNGRDGFVQIAQPKAVFFRNFGDSKTSDPIGGDGNPNEVIHFKKYNPNDSYYGMPDIIAAMTPVAGNKFADSFNLDYFENKAVPRHVVIVKGGKMGEAQQKQVLKFFDEDLRGNHHRTLYVSLPADTGDRKSSIEIKPVEGGVQEGSFSQYTRQNIDKILMVHRVPPTKAGVGGDANLATARDADKSFKESVCRPAQRMFEKRIDKILNTKTDVFRFKFNELTLSDEQQQAAIDQIYWNMGAITANEVRAREGKPGLDGGDDTAPKMEEKRELDRAANASDSVGEARGTKGEGRVQQ